MAIQENKKVMKAGDFLWLFWIKCLELTFSKVRLSEEIILIRIKCWRIFAYIISFKIYNNAIKVCYLSTYRFNMMKLKHAGVNGSGEVRSKCQVFLSQSPWYSSAISKRVSLRVVRGGQAGVGRLWCCCRKLSGVPSLSYLSLKTGSHIIMEEANMVDQDRAVVWAIWLELRLLSCAHAEDVSQNTGQRLYA